jgi:hypothetical protein
VVLHPDDAYLQTPTAIEMLDGRKEDVVRVRLYVNRQEDCDSVGRGMRDAKTPGGSNVAWAAAMIVGVGFIKNETTQLNHVWVSQFVPIGKSVTTPPSQNRNPGIFFPLHFSTFSVKFCWQVTSAYTRHNF